MVHYTRCPRCQGPFIGSYGQFSCLSCGWDGPTRRPTKMEKHEAMLDAQPVADTPKKPKSSQYYGVSHFTTRWVAQIDVQGPNGREHKTLRTWTTELEAAQAVDRGLISYGLAPRNFPKENYLTSAS